MRGPNALLCLLGLLMPLNTARGAAAPSGALRIVTQPQVEVIWDGTSLGVTDETGVMQVAEIPPGQYRVRLHRPGYQAVDATVTVGSGQSTLDFELVELAAPTPPTSAATEAVRRTKHQHSTASLPQERISRPPNAEVRPAGTPAVTAEPSTNTTPAASPEPQPETERPPEPSRVDEAEGRSALAIYLVLAALLVGLGALLMRRRMRPQGLLLQASAGPFRSSGGRGETGTPAPFADEIKRRELALDQFLDTGQGVYRRTQPDEEEQG